MNATDGGKIGFRSDGLFWGIGRKFTEKMKTNLLPMKIIASIPAAIFSIAVAAQAAGEMHAFVQDSRTKHELLMDLRDGAEAADTNGMTWRLGVESAAVAGQPDAQDYRLTWTVTTGQVESASVGVVFEFKDWSPENLVLVPAAVYDGNRFDIKRISYPPYWYNTNEWRIDMPTTMTPNPTLGRGPGGGRIRLSTGDASVPMLAYQSPLKKVGWMVQTTQDSRFGNHQMLVEENDGRTTARFEIFTPSASWKAGDTVTIPIRVYQFPAKTRTDLLRRFFDARKDLNPVERKEELPFSAAWGLLNDLYQNHRWDERTGLYWFSEPGPGKSWNNIWQLGWCGGGQVTLAMLIQGDEQARQRASRNLDVIFTKTQASSGFFYAIGNGEKFASFGFGKNFTNNDCLVRSQGDWLYMAQRQFQQIKAEGGTVPEAWMAGLKKEADAFARLWDKRGQFGQFVNVETGDLCIGGSTSGAIVPGGMALASQTFHERRYLKVAEAAARKYYKEFVLAGYTTGGPGEILSAPDSESAFGLFESFMALHEITGNSEWLRDANDLLPICASWTVAYDYHFPTNSAMGRIGAHSCGAVWANVQNKHGAPAICTWSGDSLLKYYRATGDRRALELLADIAHGVPQYISRTDHPIGRMPPGGMCERVNLSAWEGTRNVGGSIFGSCPWVETAAMLTVTELPGVYVRPDTGLVVAFDNVRVEEVSHSGKTVKFRLVNPTKFAADVSVLVESARAAQRPVGSFVEKPLPVVHLDAGASTTLEYTASSRSRVSSAVAVHAASRRWLSFLR
jgi:hypothetical protein